MKRNTKECQECGTHVSLSNFKAHAGSKSCHNGGSYRTKTDKLPWREWQVAEGLFKLPCGYVGDKISCRNKLNCPTEGTSNLEQYNRQIKSGERPLHNKGRATPQNVKKKISSALKEFNAINQRPPISEETRKRLSEKKKDFLRKHPELHLNAIMACNKTRMTYPEKVAHEWFQRNKIQAYYNKRAGSYYPDFTVENVIVEIDGERWHGSPEQKERDSKRDAVLMGMGFTIYRLAAKSRIEERLEEIFS